MCLVLAEKAELSDLKRAPLFVTSTVTGRLILIPTNGKT